MGMLERFEQNIERAVNGAFAKAFRSQVQPIELIAGIRREADEKSTIVGRDRTLIPNAYTFTLAEADFDRIHEWESDLAQELTDSLTEHARQQRYSFAGPIMIRFQRSEQLETGVFHIVSSRQSSAIRPASSQGAPEPPLHQPTPAPAPEPYEDAAPAPDAHLPSALQSGYRGQVPPRGGSPLAGLARSARSSAPGFPDGGTPGLALSVDGIEYQVGHNPSIIGRGRDADITLDDAGVSRHHAEVCADGASLALHDLGSTNGTFVNGRRVTTARVNVGDIITMGQSRLTVTQDETRGDR